MEELERQGKKIPEDVAVTGYDNSLYARQGQGITTITYPQENWEINAYPVNEIAEYVQDVSQGDIDVLVEEYYNKYDMILDGRDPEEFKEHVAVQAGIEIGFERFLEEKNYQAVVTHFGDLGSLKQLPGLAIQRLMEKAMASVARVTGKQQLWGLKRFILMAIQRSGICRMS